MRIVTFPVRTGRSVSPRAEPQAASASAPVAATTSPRTENLDTRNSFT